MPSHLHEMLLLLFRNQPELAPDLLRAALRTHVPAYTEARFESAELNEMPPTEYRADAVVVLRRRQPVLGIVVEVQLRRSVDKRYTWPVYVSALRARLRCPVCLLVVTASDDVARWAARPIDLGSGSSLAALVVGPSGVPVVTSARAAKRDPELAVLSAMSHGRRLPSRKAARVALAAVAATQGLDEDRGEMYFDLILSSLSEAARKELQAMEPAKYEYQSAFAKRYFGKGIAQGRAEGRAEGKAEGQVEGRVEGEASGRLQGAAELVLRLLRRRFGVLGAHDVDRVRRASIVDLDRFAERLLTAESLDAVWGAATNEESRAGQRVVRKRTPRPSPSRPRSALPQRNGRA